MNRDAINYANDDGEPMHEIRKQSLRNIVKIIIMHIGFA